MFRSSRAVMDYIGSLSPTVGGTYLWFLSIQNIRYLNIGKSSGKAKNIHRWLSKSPPPGLCCQGYIRLLQLCVRV